MGLLSLSETVFIYCFSVAQIQILTPLLKAENFKDEFSELVLWFLELAL